MDMEHIVAEARSWIGTPYHHQGAVKGAGADCLGLVRGVYREVYGFDPEVPPAYTPTWGEYDKVELMLEAARRNLVEVRSAEPGQLVPYVGVEPPALGSVLLFRARLGAVAKHCGIVTGEDTMVHSYSGVGVRETSIGIWRARIAGVFRFP